MIKEAAGLRELLRQRELRERCPHHYWEPVPAPVMALNPNRALIAGSVPGEFLKRCRRCGIVK